MNSNYEAWNKKLLKHFFPISTINEHVRLNVDFELLDTLAPELGGHTGFIQAIQAGPACATSPNLFSRVNRLHSMKNKTIRRPVEYQNLIIDSDDPPYLGYLCLLCLAWQVKGEHTANAYYPKLESLYEHHGIKAQNFERWSIFWTYLKNWSERKKRGLMNLDALGMPYVGIPRGQVIFTPAKVRSFPSFLRSIHAHQLDDKDSFVKKIKNHDTASKSFLGVLLYNSIIKEYPNESLGKGAVDQLFAFLETWNGRQQRKIISGAGALIHANNTLEYNLDHLLIYNKKDNSWDVGFALNNADLPVSENLLIENHRFTPINSRNGDYSFIKKEDNFLKATQENLTLKAKTEETNITINLICPNSKILFFQNFLNRKYTGESSESQNDQGCFVCNNSLLSSLKEWVKSHDLLNQLEDHIDKERTLLILKGLDSLSEAAWSEYAKFSKVRLGASKSSSSKIKLRSGTRTSRSGSYLDFDLPYVEILDTDLLEQGSLECIGGTLQQFEVDNDQPHSKNYKIIPDQGVDFICVKAKFDSTIIDQEACFYLDSPSEYTTKGILDSNGINKFGAPEDLSHNPGVKGVSTMGVDLPKDPQFFDTNKHRINSIEIVDFDISNLVNLPSYQFLQALQMESDRKKVSIRQGFDLARRLLNNESLDRREYNKQLILLRDLGYLEIGCDRKNRWTHLIPCPAGFCLLPTKQDNMFCVTVAGAWSVNDLEKLMVKLQDEKISFHVTYTDNNFLIPPKILITTLDLDKLKWASDIPIPACSNSEAILTFSGGLDDWEANLTKHPLTHYSDRREGYYEPNKFRREYTQEKRHGTGWLEFYEDPETGFHQVFQLYRNHVIDENQQFYAVLRNPTWARWWMHDRELVSPIYDPSNQDDDNEDESVVYIGYKTNDHSLWVPHYLDFPQILRRALILCSFTPPRVCEVKPNNSTLRGQRVKKWLVYNSTPPFIAKMLAEKLNAQIYEF